MAEIYIDIETTGNAGIIQFLPEPTPPGNYKKPESIARWVDEAKQKQIAKAALDLDAARIISIAVAKDDGEPMGWAIPDDKRQNSLEEAAIIGSFWDWVAGDVFAGDAVRFIGYNIRNFDLPILLRRTWQLGIAPPLNIAPMITRTSAQVVDLMEALYHNGYTGTRYRGLKTVCKMYGIENSMPDADGSMVDELSAGELLAYNLNDVALTQRLAQITKGHYWF